MLTRTGNLLSAWDAIYRTLALTFGLTFAQSQGAEWEQALTYGLDRAEVVILVLSPEALASDWVQRELSMARRSGKRLLPVLMRGEVDTLPPDLAAIQFVDFRTDYGPAFARLLASLQVAPTPLRAVEDAEPRDIPSPFKGLEAFQEADAPYFFGRDKLIDSLVERLRAQPGQPPNRFLTLIGASGSGKSSVVRAVLIPRLRSGALPGSETWPVVIFTPGPRPLESLATRLLPLVGGELWTLMDSLDARKDRLHLAIQSLLAQASDATRVVLVVDQFEEIFTRAAEAERLRFLDLLLHTATVDGGKGLVIITLRADFYAPCTRHPELARLLEAHQVIVTPLLRNELREAISAPAEVVGLRYRDGLVDTLLDDVHGQDGALPLLQYALQELYQRREGRDLTVTAYERIGGVHGALARRAEDVFEALGPAQRDVVRRLLLRLVEVDERGEPTRRRVERAALHFAGVDDDDVDAVLAVLTHPDVRLLTAGRELRSGDAWVEVSHEALIHAWERLRLWITESIDALRLSGRLLKDAQEWEAASRDEAYLLRGLRLSEAETWLEDPDADPMPLLRAYIETSQALSEHERLEREAQLQRELEMQREVAEQRRRAANLLRYLAAGLAVFLVVAIGLSLFAFSEQDKAQEAAAQAGTQAAIAVAAEATAARHAEESRSLALAAYAQQAFDSGDQDLARTLALEANRIPDPPALSQRRLANMAYAPGPRLGFQGHTGIVTAVAISSDGRFALSGSADRLVILWNLQTGQEIRRFEGHEDALVQVAFSPDGQTALSTSGDNTAILWDVATGMELRRFEGRYDWDLSGAAYSPDGWMAVVEVGESIAPWDLTTGVMGEPYEEAHAEAVEFVAFSSDGETVLSVVSDSLRKDALSLWDFATGEVRQRFEVDMDAIHSVAFSPDGRTILVAGCIPDTSEGYPWCGQEVLVQWDVTTGRKTRAFAWQGGWIWWVDFSPDGTRAYALSCAERNPAVAGCVHTVVVEWDVATGEAIRRIQGEGESGRLAALSADGRTMITASDGDLYVWDVDAGSQLRRIQWHSRRARSFAFSPDGKTALTASDDESLLLWDLATGSVLRRFEGHTAAVIAVALSPSGTTALSVQEGGLLILWDVATGKALSQASNIYGIRQIAFSPDGERAFLRGVNNILIVWDVNAGEIVRRFERYPVTVSLDGQMALTATEDYALVLVEVASGDEVRRFEGHTAEITSVALSPDARYAMSAACVEVDGSTYRCNKTELLLWDVETGRVNYRLDDFSGRITSLAFTLNGWTVLSGSDSAVVVWDVNESWFTERQRLETGQNVSELEKLVFSPDERTVFARRSDYTLYLWDVVTGERLVTVSGASGEPNDLVFSADGQLALFRDQNGHIALWGLVAGDRLRTFLAASSITQDMPNSRHQYQREVLMPVSEPEEEWSDWEVGVWEACAANCALALHSITIQRDGPAGAEVHRFFGGGMQPPPWYWWEEYNPVALSPDGRTAVSTTCVFASHGICETAVLIYWDMTTGEQKDQSFIYTYGNLISLAPSPDDPTVLLGFYNGQVLMWDIEQDEEVWSRAYDVLVGITAVAFNPAGDRALTGSADGKIALLSAADGHTIWEAQAGAAGVNALAFSPDGRLILSGSDVLLLWDMETGQLLRRFDGHAAVVTSVAFSADGETALSGSQDSSAILWEVASGQELRRFEGHLGAVNAVAFSRNERIALVSTDATVTLWRIDTVDALVSWTRANRPVRELTCVERLSFQVEPFCSTETGLPFLMPLPAPVGAN
ncbi:MAG: TIR domain-containing protein [Anaerolineae bacterium]|nr:TIR domain-containing protein [Anaerolineae bacterium]